MFHRKTKKKIFVTQREQAILTAKIFSLSFSPLMKQTEITLNNLLIEPRHLYLGFGFVTGGGGLSQLKRNGFHRVLSTGPGENKKRPMLLINFAYP